MHDEYLTVPEAATLLRTTTKYVYKLIYTRRIPVYKPLGRKVLFKKSELEALFENSRQATIDELQTKACDALNSRGAK